MDVKQYEVEVVYRQRAVYLVSAPDRESAEREAAALWQQGRPSMVSGFEWAELEVVRADEAADPEESAKDGELVLRYLRERERLILQLGGGAHSPTFNDAISADQVAADLGWSLRGQGKGSPDIPRATQALERLCRDRKVVCFERPRVRSGERGEVRLYCTPAYLERLTSDFDEVRQEAV